MTDVVEMPEHGEKLLVWEYYDRPKYERGRWWYLIMSTFGVGLLLFALFTANFLFALIIVMAALVIYVSTIFEPKPVKIAITEMGFEIGRDFYPFRDIQYFWFFYDPPMVKSLYLDFYGVGASRMKVDLEDQNPNLVRSVLARYVREDVTQVDEPLSDTLSRLFKI